MFAIFCDIVSYGCIQRYLIECLLSAKIPGERFYMQNRLVLCLLVSLMVTVLMGVVPVSIITVSIICLSICHSRQIRALVLGIEDVNFKEISID